MNSRKFSNTYVELVKELIDGREEFDENN